MVYELGHVDDRFKNTNNNIGRCGSNYVNKFIGNIAKDYMETTEGENWASSLISHLNSRFPTSADNPKNFIQQEVQDANLHQIISSQSSLPDLLLSNSYFSSQNDMNLGYSRYSPASVNVYNPILCGGSAYNEYIQNAAYSGAHLISPLGVKQSDSDIITSPEQASTVTACSYGDIISDTEVFDSLTAISSFQQPFHNSQYISAHNMGHSLLSVDDVQSPYSNLCNVQQSFHNLPEASDAYGVKVLSAYVMYKDMPASLRKEVSFQDYMHAAECEGNLCKCHLHLELASHFDKCNDLDCGVCGPARSASGDTGGFQLESRKRKVDRSEAIDNTGPTSSGTLLDVLPTKYPKLASSTVGEDVQRREVNVAHDQQEATVVSQSNNATGDDQRKEVNGTSDQQELVVVNQSDNAVENEMTKCPKLESSTVDEGAMSDDQRRKANDAHDQRESIEVNQNDNVSNNEIMKHPKSDDQEVICSHDRQQSTVVHRSDNIVNNEMLEYPKLDSLTQGEDATDDEQRKEVDGADGQQDLTVVSQSDNVVVNSEMMKHSKLDSSEVGEVNDQQEPTVVDRGDIIANDEILKYPKLNSSNVGEDAMGNDQKKEVKGTHDPQELSVVCRSNDNVVNDEMGNCPKSDGSTVAEDAMVVDQRREVNSVHDQQESTVVDQSDYNPKLDSSTIGEDAVGDEQKRTINGAHDELESTVVNQTRNIANNWMLKYPILESSTVGEKKSTVVKQSDNIVNNEMKNSPKLSIITDEKEKYGEAIVDANNDSNFGADVADLNSDKAMAPDASIVDCDSAANIKNASLTDNAMMKSPQLCSDHDHLSSKETIINEKEKSGEAIIEANTDSSSGADVADLTSNKSMTPDVSMVDCDSVLESDHTKTKVASLTVNELIRSPLVLSDYHSSKEMIIDEKEKSGADVADLNSNKSMKPNVSVVGCESVLESDNTKTKATSLTDNESQLEPEKIKIQSVSLADFFTADQIKEHLLSFTSQKASSENRAPSIGPNTCHLCSNDKLVFAPTPIYCSSCDTRIKRNVGYYRTTSEIGARHCFCIPCYRGTHGNNILMRGYGYSMPKSNLQRARNDEEKEDSWVLCDKCQNWQHRICGLYNDEKDVEGKAEYICPKCYLQELESGIRVPLPQSTASGAKDLPRTNLSDHIEQRLFERLNQERQDMAKVSGIKPSEVPTAEGLVVRVVVSVEKQLEVRQKFRSILHGEYYPSGFTYRSKLIFLFQKIEGVDVCLFGMCVQEFGSECGGPNNRCVYISYLDSVKYFRPERKCVTGESLRTFIYHEILIGYLDYCKKRGFATCYIWACPLVKGEDYIFYCHPETQRTPKQDKLRQWYKSMLKKATEANVVIDHTNLYNQFFLPGGEGSNMKITAARLPYFDGDYWSVAAENHARKLELEETAAGGLLSKLPNKRMLKAMGQDKADIAVKDVIVMQKLGQTILTVKENFMIVHLQHICTHCREVILSGSRWFCSRCNKIQLCSRCFNADKNISESKLHTCHSGEKNKLSEVAVNDVTLDTKDTDDVLVNSFFETRDAFLNKCQKSHFQFDTLSRAKYSSMMILYHLIYKPVIKPTCTGCHSDVVVEQCFYCDTCPKYYICESCYRLRHGAYHPHRLYPPSLDIDCGSKSMQLRMQRDCQFKIVLNTLMHASECDRIPCAYKECNTIRRLFSHAVRCSVKPRRDCKFCRRVWLILRLHSQTCADSECKIPRCMDIKKHRGCL